MKKVIFKKIRPDIVALISSFLTLIIIGTLIFQYLERWSWVESVYFTVVTLTTVGYGDLSPTTDISRIAAVIFILAGISVFGSAISILGDISAKKRTKRVKERRKKRNE